MRQATEAWLAAADDDLMAIESLMVNASLSHIVAFHAQQAIEKVMKAVFEELEALTYYEEAKRFRDFVWNILNRK